MFLRRSVLILSIVVTGSLAFAASVLGAGGMGPGNYSFSSQGATAFFGMNAKGGPPAPSWSVSVNRGLNSFNPRGSVGPIVEHNTMVNITEFDAAGNGGYGCFVVPDSAFTLSRDLQSASLHATLTAAEICDGYGTPVGGKQAGAFAGGAGGGLTLPVTVDVTWTATTATSTSTDVFTFRCLNFNENGNDSLQSVQASATGSISALPGSFAADFSNVASGTSQIHINADYPAACYA